MKKWPLALAVLSSFSGIAHAQSTVTLYGIIDEGFNINTNAGGHHLYNLSSGVLQGSRWGMRGTEDLGGGLKAIFVLESGFDLNTGKLGQGGLFFGRQAYVGLGSRFGTITLGRQYDSVVDYVGQLGAADQWGGYIAAHPGDLDNFNNANRVNNAIKFTSTNYAGLTFGGLYSLGGVSGDYSRNQIWSLGVGYSNGPLTLGAGYLNVRNPNVSFFGNSNPSTINGSISNISSPVYSGYGSAHTYQVIGTGAAYSFGAATIGATYSNVKFTNLGSSYASAFAGQTATFNNGEINFKYQLTPTFLVGAAYDYTRGSSINGASAAKYQQGSAGVDYFLSKRTDVYLIGVYQHASGETANAAGTGVTAAVASINNLTPSSNSNQFTARVGIRHKF
ncbi:porin [Burkholderia cenocepacia]|uniref:porin n=1 Tax=Burkholderia cenocepacia TaxID=95486 RepID=UPI0028591D3D|nr:porin [Burkholderia cenocepacia]MDR8071880.1 porin [Burkholderia cenocepacia]